MTTDIASCVTEWLSPGRKTVVGYLHVVTGQLKRPRGGGSFFWDYVADLIDQSRIEQGKPGLPRYPDVHAIWFGYDPSKEKNHRLTKPFLRTKTSKPIAGLSSQCNFHRVELTCTIPKDGVWENGMGAFIMRATGRCLDCGGPELIQARQS